MNLSELTKILSENQEKPILVMLPDDRVIPAYFHITEIGRATKNFIDCGGTKRSSDTCILQVWVANDVDHRLTVPKLLKIIEAGTELFDLAKLPVEVEYSDGFV